MRFKQKIKFIHQLQSTDCAASCLCMIINFYKKKTKLSDVKALFEFSKLGVSIQDLIDVSEKIGLNQHALKINSTEIFEIPLPSIVYWNQNHFVVLEKITKNKNGSIFTIIDPSFGKINLPEYEFYQNWKSIHNKGIVIVLEPTENFYSYKFTENNINVNNKTFLGTAKKYILNNKWKYFLSVLLMLIAICLNYFIPFIFQRIIDDGITNKAIHIIYYLIIAQFTIFISGFAADFLSTFIITKINFLLSIKLKENLLYKLMKLPLSYFDTNLNSETYQRINDHNKIQTFITWKGIDFFINSINIIVFCAILFYFNNTVFFGFVILSVISMIWVLLFLKKRANNDYILFFNQSEYHNTIYEFIMNMPEIKINNAQNKFIDNISKVQEKINKIELKSLFLNIYQNSGVIFFTKLGELFAVVYCAIQVIDNQITLGVLLSISYIIGQITRPLMNTVNFIQEAQEAKIANQRIGEIYCNENETDSTNIAIEKISINNLYFKNVYFKYSGTANLFVLEDISFTIPKNSLTAIVGASGSGKTTLLKLLLAYHPVSQGNLFLDDFNMNNINKDDWREKCGIVLQDGKIFSKSLAENISLSSEKTDYKRIETACKIACLDDLIHNLPMGYNTLIGNNGLELSGGQKQRILIARAVYKNPDFVFLDEATSALDAVTEKRIHNNLITFFKNKTVLVIAHRLSTVKRADQIIVLKNGGIVEIGKHEQLVINKSEYYNLVSNQLDLE